MTLPSMSGRAKADLLQAIDDCRLANIGQTNYHQHHTSSQLQTPVVALVAFHRHVSCFLICFEPLASNGFCQFCRQSTQGPRILCPHVFQCKVPDLDQVPGSSDSASRSHTRHWPKYPSCTPHVSLMVMYPSCLCRIMWHLFSDAIVSLRESHFKGWRCQRVKREHKTKEKLSQATNMVAQLPRSRSYAA